MQVKKIPLNQLIPHESAIIKSRVAKVSSPEGFPIVVKPLDNTDYFYIYQGHHRAWNAASEGLTEIDALVAPPDFLDSRDATVQKQMARNPDFPLASLSLVDDDKERQRLFFRETYGLSKTPQINLHRGTMLRLVVTLSLSSGKTFQTVVLPQKEGCGGLILRPYLACKYFKEGCIDAERISRAWGDESYDPSVLPGYIEIGRDGRQCRGGGFVLDVSFYLQGEHTIQDVNERPIVSGMRGLVLYPDGNIWEGEINASEATSVMVLWDDALIHSLGDEKEIESFFSARSWWETPTTMIVHTKEFGGPRIGACLFIEHSCGTCT